MSKSKGAEKTPAIATVDIQTADDAESAQPRLAATRIDVLQEHGVNVSDVKKLREAGFCTIESLQQATKKELLEVKGITDARYASLTEASAKITGMHTGQFRTAVQFREEQNMRFRVSTGSKEFDALMGGGIESKALTEIFGEYRTGKTQICATLAVTAQLDPKHGGKVVYVDTEGNFFPERLRAICDRFGVEHDTVLENIIVARVFNTDQQEAIPGLIEQQIDQDNGAPYAMVIIDSLMSLWRVDFNGRGELSERQQRLGKHLNLLRRLAERHNIAVVYTNQVMSDPSGGLTFVPDPKKAVGGHVVAHASNVRISLRKGRDAERIAKLVDSPTMPEADATFSLGSGGIGDA